MLLKVLGSILVLSASSVLGLVLASDCAKRPQILKQLQTLFEAFENELRFMSSILEESFEKLGKSYKNQASEIFLDTAEKLKTGEVNADEAWKYALVKFSSKGILKQEDIAILQNFGPMLGASDLEGQLGNIRLLKSQLVLQIEKAEEARKKNQKMYQTLGILSGLAVVIILL